jgi:hypothetical protein
VRRKTARFCQRRTSEPKLRKHFVAFDVHVTGLATVTAEEKEAVRAEASDRWHVSAKYTPSDRGTPRTGTFRGLVGRDSRTSGLCGRKTTAVSRHSGGPTFFA